jgi:hypothetical protein
VTTIEDAINRAIESPADPGGTYCITLAKEVFSGVPKWNGKLPDIPLNRDRAQALFREQKNLFSENGKWSLKGMSLMSVCESEGNYVWIGLFEKEITGGYSFIPRAFIYMKMDGKFVSPRPSKGETRESLKRVFGEAIMPLAEKN